MHRSSTIVLAGVLAFAGVAGAQQGKFLDLVVTTNDGDSIVEPGESALICLYVNMTPNVGEGIAAFGAAVFDTVNVQNGETGQITDYGCLNPLDLCSPNDQTTSDGVNLFGTSVGQVLFGQYNDDDPIGVYQFRWETNDYSQRVVKYTTITSMMAFWEDEFTSVDVRDVIEADVAFCVGSCSPFDGPDELNGLPHDGGGGGVVFGTDLAGVPQAEGIGQTQETITIQCGYSDNFMTAAIPGATPNGSYIEYSALQEIIGGPLEEILSTRILYDNDVLNFYFDAAPVTPAAESVVGELQGVVVLASTCNECNFANDAMFKVPGAEIAMASPYEVDGSDGVARFEFAEPVEMFAFDGQSAVVDAVEIRAIGIDPAPSMTHVQHNMSNLEFLKIRSETIGMFGNQHRSLDGAWMRGDSGGDLVISNIGSSGEDGVALDDIPSESIAITYSELEPVGMAGDQFFDVDVSWGQTTFRTEIVSLSLVGLTPSERIMTPKMGAIAPEDGLVEVQLLAAGNAVATLVGPVNDPPAIVAQGLEVPTLTADKSSPKLLLKCAGGSFFQAFDADGNLLGTIDEIVYSVSPQDGQAEAILGARLRGRLLDELRIHDEVVIPLSACFADCDGNGVLNILDFVCYQGLFVGGDPAADCDGNGVLNILDFVCFQGEFTAGCG